MVNRSRPCRYQCRCLVSNRSSGADRFSCVQPAVNDMPSKWIGQSRSSMKDCTRKQLSESGKTWPVLSARHIVVFGRVTPTPSIHPVSSDCHTVLQAMLHAPGDETTPSLFAVDCVTYKKLPVLWCRYPTLRGTYPALCGIYPALCGIYQALCGI